jgi:hypothetical protein
MTICWILAPLSTWTWLAESHSRHQQQDRYRARHTQHDRVLRRNELRQVRVTQRPPIVTTLPDRCDPVQEQEPSTRIPNMTYGEGGHK